MPSIKRTRTRGGCSPQPHLVGLRADVGLCVFEPRDGAVAEPAHHRHQRVEVLQLQQFLSTSRRKYYEWGRERRQWKERVAKREFGDGEKERVAKVTQYFQGMEKVRAELEETFTALNSPHTHARMNLVWLYQGRTECSSLVYVRLQLTLCEWQSAGRHAALQPAWRITENQWGRSCVGGPPEGIIWFSSDTLWNEMAEHSIRRVGSAKRNRPRSPGKVSPSTCRRFSLNERCVHVGAMRRRLISCQLIVMPQLIGDVSYSSKPNSTETCTRNILWN